MNKIQRIILSLYVLLVSGLWIYFSYQSGNNCEPLPCWLANLIVLPALLLFFIGIPTLILVLIWDERKIDNQITSSGRSLKIFMSVMIMAFIVTAIFFYLMYRDSLSKKDKISKSVISPTVSKARQYTEVFRASGKEGSRNTETFSIKGDRFKIKYECSSKCIMALECKQNSGRLSNDTQSCEGESQLIFHYESTPIKDESIIYKSGDNMYLNISAEGDYSIIIEDYR